MKKIITIIAATMAVLCLSTSASAHKRCGEEWKEKMKSEKIAFLTTEIGLTPEEAQVFWPVYNQIEKEKDDAMRKVINSYKELSKAMEEEKPEKEISTLLDKYIAAQAEINAVENSIAERYKAVLPVEKVAKLYVSEERFRRNHIRRLHGGGERPGQPAHPGPRQ